MNKFALLKLHYGANMVVDEIRTTDLTSAIKHFQTIFSTTDKQTLDDSGYLKVGDVTFCVASYLHN